MSDEGSYLLVVGGGMLLVGGAAWASYTQALNTQQAWVSLARRLAVPFVPPGLWSKLVLQGTWRDHAILVCTLVRGSGKTARKFTVFQVRINGDTAPVRVAARGFWQTLRSMVLETEAQTGDADFDGAVSVVAPPDWALVALSAPTRSRLRALVEMGGWVEGGMVKLELEGTVRDPARMERILALLVEVAGRMDVPDDVLRRKLLSLSSSLTHSEPALRVLVERHGDTPEARKALAAGLVAPLWEQRLQAAALSGAAGVPVLQALIEEAAPDTRRAEAFEALIRAATYGDYTDTVRAALTSDADALRAAALALVVAQGDGSHQEEVWIALERGGALTLPEAARAMGVAAHPRNEDELVKLLGHAAPEVRLAAVESLGRIGTERTIHALQGLHSLDPRLLLAARAAQHDIRARRS